MFIAVLDRDIYALAICFLILTLVFFLSVKRDKIRKKKASLFIFGYHIIYSDSRSAKRKAGVEYSKLLRSTKHDITGKPDYIFRRNNGKALIPVELKSGEAGDNLTPYYGDMLQLGAYFLIIEDVYGVRPKTGRLVYKDYMFIIRNTKSIRNEVLTALKAMRSMLQNGEGEANNSFVNCRHCMCRGTVCEKNQH